MKLINQPIQSFLIKCGVTVRLVSSPDHHFPRTINLVPFPVSMDKLLTLPKTIPTLRRSFT